jgi:galactose oxidase
MMGTLVFSLALAAVFFGFQTNAITLPYIPPPADVLKAEGFNQTNTFIGFAAVVAGNTISQNGWTVTADSWQPGNEPQKAIDGNSGTFWHTEWTPTEAPTMWMALHTSHAKMAIQMGILGSIRYLRVRMGIIGR